MLRRERSTSTSRLLSEVSDRAHLVIVLKELTREALIMAVVHSITHYGALAFWIGVRVLVAVSPVGFGAPKSTRITDLLESALD